MTTSASPPCRIIARAAGRFAKCIISQILLHILNYKIKKDDFIMFNQIDPKELAFNPFREIGERWMLITAGDSEKAKANTMTASWGGAGVLWNKNVVTCYVRPQRYTRQFIDSSEYFSLGFFPEEARKQLVYCGRVSGRDEDKIAGSGLTVCNDRQAPYFEEADTVLICKKIYVGEIKPEGVLYPELDEANYPAKDYHIVYIGEIVEALKK